MSSFSKWRNKDTTNKSKWNDNRATDAFKSTRRLKSNSNSNINKPKNTRIWKDKNIKSSNPTIPVNNRQWKRDNSDKNVESKKTDKSVKIESKWTAKREKTTDIFNRNTVNNENNSNILINQTINQKINRKPEEKSFNKKIVVIERKTRKQIAAEKKAVYDSFIKESFILKVADHLKKQKTTSYVSRDIWDSLSDNDEPESHLTKFDKWERNLLKEMEGDEDDYDICVKKRKGYFTGRLASLSKYYELPKLKNTYEEIKYNNNYNKYYEEKKKTRLMNDLIGLCLLPSFDTEDSRENIDEGLNSLYEFMISKKMRVDDISFDYNTDKLVELDDKSLNRTFNKLRKKYNSLKRIGKKIKDNIQLQKAEKEKYDNRHETIFLYHRLRYYDSFYMDGSLNFVNNIN